MIPLYFGPSDRSLYGAYEPPTGRDLKVGVVICPPVGEEYYHAHRPCRLLAVELARAGLHVLRFDYLGTGDSALELVDTDLGEWLANIDSAVTELRDMSEVSRVRLVGLRFGAALVGEIGRQRTDVDRVVLWDPLDDPGSHLRERLPEWSGGRPGPDVAAKVGVVPEPEAARTLLISTTGARADTGRIDGVERIDAPGPKAWEEFGNVGRAGLPADAIQRIASWVADV